MTFLAVLALLLTAACVAALLSAAFAPRAQVAGRLREIEHYGYQAPTTGGALLADDDRSPVRAAVEALGRLVLVRTGRAEQLRQDLVAAGRTDGRPEEVVGRQVLCAVGLAAVGIAVDLVPVLGGPIVDTVLLGVMGWVLPPTLVRRTARLRLARIDRELPDVIDLVVICIEAGAGFGAALQRAAQDRPGPLGDELRLVLQEQRFGLSLGQALEHLGDRARTPNVRTFVRGVVQGEKLGVSIGQIMRGLAQEMRLRRRQAAEERAQKTSVRILFPLVLLILPPLLIVVLGPSMARIMSTFGG